MKKETKNSNNEFLRRIKKEYYNKKYDEIFKKILRKNLNATNEKILIVGDNGIKNKRAARVLTEYYKMAAEELGLEYEVVIQESKDRGESASPALIKKIKSLPKKSIAIVNVSNRIGTMKSLGKSFRKYMKTNNHRFISASTLGSLKMKDLPMFINAMNIDYKEITKKATALKKAFDNGTEAELRTKKGTQVVFGIERMKARNSLGIYKQPGTGGNLPGAETYIAPYKKEVNGTIIIDGSMRLKDKSQLIKSEEGLKLQIKNGKIIRMNNTIEAKKLEKTLRWAEKKSKYDWGVRRIGELGIGLNPKAKIVGSTIIDEKVLGTAHIAIGSNYWFGGTIYSIIHLDQVMKEAQLRINSRRIHLK